MATFSCYTHDALALHSALVIPLLITSFVAFSHFVATKEALLATVSLLTMVLYILMLDAAMLYRYTMDPQFYRVFDASQRGEEINFFGTPVLSLRMRSSCFTKSSGCLTDKN